MKLRVWFTDFWEVFKKEDNFFLNILKELYEVELDKTNPDVLFFSVFGAEHWKYNCRKVQFIGENLRPDFDACDFSLSFDHDSYGGRNFRLPLYVLWNNPSKLLNKAHVNELFRAKTKFCNFVYSNASAKKRIDFFRKLSRYKKVDSGGRLLNNIGYRIQDKLDFQSQYKFSIAFENSEYPGYTTEKIFEPMLAGSVPIYWGNSDVGKDFNPKSFLCLHDFRDENELIEKIIELDQNDDLYMEILNEPWFVNKELNSFSKHENILKIFREITSCDFKINPSRQKLFRADGNIRRSQYFAKKLLFSYHKFIESRLKLISLKRFIISVKKKMEL